MMECLHCLGLLRPRVCLEALVVFFTLAVGKFTVGFERWNTPAPDFLPTPSNITFYTGELAVLRCSVFNLGTKTVVPHTCTQVYMISVDPDQTASNAPYDQDPHCSALIARRWIGFRTVGYTHQNGELAVCSDSGRGKGCFCDQCAPGSDGELLAVGSGAALFATHHAELFTQGDYLLVASSITHITANFVNGSEMVVWRRLDSSFPITSGTMTVVSDNRFQIGHVSYKNQWDLMIKNVQPDDEGVYECQVASTDKKIRRLIWLTVLDKEYDNPDIQISDQQYVERGEEIHLRCNATGAYYPPKEMDWFRNGERLMSRTNKGMRITKQYSILQRTFTSDLTITRAEREDDGTYVCRSSDMQITSTKVHVLNAETFNKKRGTLNEKEDQFAPIVDGQRSSQATVLTSGHLAVIFVSIAFLLVL